MKSTTFVKAGVTGLSAVALVLLGLSAASAEPTTANRPLAVVGSDTTQDVWNGLSNQGPVRTVANFNAFGEPATITPKPGVTLSRPAGSGAGVKALSAAHNPANHVYNDGTTSYTLAEADIDVARSSSSPSKAGTELTFLPFARDAVTVAYKNATGKSLDLTTNQVKNIFSCTEGEGVTVVGGKPVFDGITLTPKLPQASSGTRSFFLKAVGISTVSDACIPAATEQGYPENSGAALVNEGDIIPFSAAQWIAQKNGAMANTTQAGQKLADLNGLKGVDPASTAGALKPGTLYGSTASAPASGFGTFARDTYNVVSSDVQTSTEHKDVLVRNAVTKQLKTTAGKAIISKYGFKNLNYVGDWDLGKPSGFTN